MSAQVKPMRAAIYARISDDPEGREAGVARQVEDCEALIERLGWAMAPYKPFIDNDISASTLSSKRRPAYEELMGRVRDGEVDAIVFYTNGRLTRRPREYEDLIELFLRTGVVLKSVKSVDADLSTADGRMIARVLAAQDAAEAERISERVSRAFVQRRADGQMMPSSRAFGFEKGGVDINEEEATLIREAVNRVVNESWSLGMVVADWNKRKVPNLRGGGGWSRATVKRAISSPRTAGLITCNGEILGEAKERGIITPAEREQVLAALRARIRNGGVSYKQRQHVLAGFMVCGKCGKPMKVNAMYEEDGSYRKDSFIVCSRSQFGCGNVKRNFAHVMTYVDGLVRRKIELREPMGEAELTGEVDAQVRELEGQLAEIETDLEELQESFNAREIRFKDYNAALAVLRDQQEVVTRSIDETQQRATVEPDLDLLAAWEDGGVEEKRAVMAWAIDHIKLHPIGRVGPVKAKALTPTATEVIFRD